MSLKPGDELDQDTDPNRTEAQKATEVVDSEDDEVGNVNINGFRLALVILHKICTRSRMTPKRKILKTTRERAER